ncbi:unnamed protein product [Ambrosiozyma monospora]|uniref:Unnamed protein product n=1 Tax=Ambrosiozyma monospora TaxID=43982 RepID=A0ACB5SZK7_AMBMO|nr:unnamed protein product [Ambrosiozyma monospora]
MHVIPEGVSTTTLIATLIASIAIAAPVPDASLSESSALPVASSSSSAQIVQASTGFSNSTTDATTDDLIPVEKASKLGTASTVLGVLSGAGKGYDWLSDKLGWNN